MRTPGLLQVVLHTPCQSDHVLDEGKTVKLSEIDDEVLAPFRFECAGSIRGSKKELPGLEHKPAGECFGALPIHRPDESFKNRSVLLPPTQGSSVDAAY
ncbi:MAG: hypothetical protein A2170_10215 [Deltaproteobacteria bacterium RBG_13_53_10]|nr:MAG: hypothetical protein A2170_10215 [Deltaproteobacteria bacterium RBG_13_53_10]